jgi:hypothetical protein
MIAEGIVLFTTVVVVSLRTAQLRHDRHAPTPYTPRHRP